MKTLFTYDYGKDKMNLIKETGYEIKIVSEKNLVYNDEIGDTEILVCYNPFETLDISKMKNLRWIQLSSIGIDQVPLDKIKRPGIILTNNRGGYSIPMGEWIVLKILEYFKKSHEFYKKQRDRKWEMDTGILELYQKKVGFIGTGSIALEAAKRLRSFEVEVLGVNTSGRNVDYFDKCFSIENMEQMLMLCDVVVVTVPYTNKTHHMIDKDCFSAMKKGVFFINVSRGTIVDERALINNLESKRIGGAALDVVEEEPLRAESPLWDMENVIITPHNSWISERRNERRFETIYKNMKRYKAGEKLLNVIDIEKGY